MATPGTNQKGIATITSAADEAFTVGATKVDTAAATLTLQIVGTGWTGTLTVKGRALGSGAAAAAIAYRTAAAPGTPVTTGITADALIFVDTPGLEVVLDHAWDAGSVTVTAVKSIGV